MDYAKLALIKAEEIEARLKINDGMSAISKTSVLDIFLKQDIARSFLRINGNHTAGIFVSLKLENALENIQISLLAGEKILSTESAEGQGLTFIGTVDLREVVELSLKSNADINIIRADILIMGAASFEAEPFIMNACDINSSFGLVKIKNGETRVYITNDKADLLMQKSLLLGFGDNADICGFLVENQPMFAVAHKDKHHNAFLSIIKLNEHEDKNKSYQIISSNFLISKAECVVLTYSSETGLVFGYTQKGIAYAGRIGDNLMPENVLRIDDGIRISFVKKSNPVAAVLKQQRNNTQRNIIRVSENEINFSAKLKLGIAINIS